jgi:tetratricopeptide (TPR) repeat protein
VSKNQIVPRTREELDELLEVRFQEGNIGAASLLAWELLARFPSESFVARIYVKKILRDPYVAGLELNVFQSNATDLRKAGQFQELAELAALGLLKFPAQRYLTLSLVSAAEKLLRREWIGNAIDSLGEPEEGDVVLLNAVAAFAQTEGDYERAKHIFGKLLKLEPDNEQLLQNYSASLAGHGDVDEATNLLERALAKSESPREYLHRLTPLYRRAGLDVLSKLDHLDSAYFSRCENANKARAHTDVRLFLQDFDGVRKGLEKQIEFTPSPETEFDLAECEIALNRLSDGLDRYKARFEAFPYLRWFDANLPVYRGQFLEDERLFVWNEQGIGDEIMFAMFLEELERRATNVTIATDPRLIDIFKQRYPHWTFINRHGMPEEPIDADFACPMGELMIMFMPDLLSSKQHLRQPAFEPSQSRFAEIGRLLEGKKKLRVAVTWRGGGSKVNGKIRSMPLETLMRGLPQNADVDLISLQYDGEHEQEVRDYGDTRLALSGLNNRTDLEGVFSLLRCCDAVLTVDNAVAHFAAAMGTPTAVVVPAGQVQFRWKNQSMRKLLFPSSDLFIQSIPGDWSDPVDRAWAHVLDISKN